MDPDIVRQQEEAERAAAGLAPRKPATGPAAPVHSRHAVHPADEKAENPNRRALPPLGSGRFPGEEPAPKRRVRGLLRLFLYAIGGAAVGTMGGFLGSTYLDLFKEQAELFISWMAGGFALLFGLTHLLHYDH